MERFFFEMDSRSSVYNYIIMMCLQSIFSVELINYLNSYINYTNLYNLF